MILDNGRPIGKIDLDAVPNDGLNHVRVEQIFRSLEHVFQKVPKESATPEPAASSIPSGLVNDIDEKDAAGFLVKHYVPFIGPDMGVEIVKIVKRLEVVAKVYPLSPTLEAYRMSLHYILQIAAQHQQVFCDTVEELLAE